MALQDKVYVEHYNFLNPANVIETYEFNFLNSDKEYTNYIDIKENESWRLIFEGNQNDRLYIDGLNLLNNKEIKIDENDERYINPGGNRKVVIELYTPSDNSDTYASGFLPGNFLLRLLTFEGEQKYSWLKVEAKYVNNDELKTMRKEIDELVQELSLDNRAGYFGSKYLDYKFLSINDIEILTILHSYLNKFMSIYQELINDPKLKIGSRYSWKNDEISLLDQISIKEMTKHLEKNDQIYGKSRVITSNLFENIDLKRDLIYLRDKISRVLGHLNKELSFTKFLSGEKDNPLMDDKKIANLYLNAFNNLLNEEWLAKLSTDYFVPEHISTTDRRYAFFRKLVEKIKKSSYHMPEFHRQYGYYWKRTELLYEIWGFLKVIRSFLDIGFTSTSGWLFDLQDGDTLPLLQDGTTVNMEFKSENLENLYAKVIYNKRVDATDASQVDIDDPVWCSSRHKKPDIRINIYDKDMTLVYLIIFDSKYRKLDSCNSGDTWEQINSYSTSFFSEYPYKSFRYEYLRKAYIEQKALDNSTYILYPKQENENISKKSANRLADGRIKAIGLRPESRSLDLEDELKKCIEKVEKWILSNAN